MSAQVYSLRELALKPVVYGLVAKRGIYILTVEEIKKECGELPSKAIQLLIEEFNRLNQDEDLIDFFQNCTDVIQKLFIFCCWYGLDDQMREIWESIAEDAREGVLRANHCLAFRSACLNAHLSIFFSLLAFSAAYPGLQQQMLEADNFGAFREACVDGCLKVVLQFWSAAAAYPGLQQQMLEAHEFGSIFTLACFNGHVGVVRQLWIWAADYPGLQRQMLRADEFGVFRVSCDKGHVGVVCELLKLAAAYPGLQRQMLRADDLGAFRVACAKGRVEIVRQLLACAKPYLKIREDMRNILTIYPDVASAAVLQRETVSANTTPFAGEASRQYLLVTQCQRQGAGFFG